MYRSPLRLIPGIQLPHDVDAARRMLQLEKKKIMAEFELAGAATITLDGQPMHRQDVISLFDELGNPTRLSYHLAIWEDATLLDFLEEGGISSEGRWAANPLYDDPGFRQFISPYFAQACNAFMQSALAGKALASELQALQKNKPLLLPADTESAYRYASRFFIEKKNELLGISYRAEADEEVTVKEISGWCADHQIHLLNRLPDTFAALRYTLANSLNNICVVYDQKKKNDLALAAVERAATIRIEDEELNRLIPSNLSIVRSKVNKGFYNVDPATGKKSPKIGLIIAIIVIIIRMAGCFLSGDHDSSTSFNGNINLSDLPQINLEDYQPKVKVLTYESLLRGLLRPTPNPYKDPRYAVSLERLKRPVAAGDNMFKGINLSGFGDSTSELSDIRSIMLIYNSTGWEANLIYQVADTEIRSVYVPPHSMYPLVYSGLQLAAQLYIGNGWSDSVQHSFKHHVTGYYAIDRLLIGGYKHRVSVSEEDTTGKPMLIRQAEDNTPHKDTINIHESPFGITADVRLGKG